MAAYGLVMPNGAYPWRDMLGDVSLHAFGAGTPTLAAWRGGNTQAPFFMLNDVTNLWFHIPHDYRIGSDLHLHAHWGHNGTAISGSFVLSYSVTYAKGHNQAAFPAEVSPVLTVSTPDIATIPQYQHRIDELQLSAASPSATQLDSDDIEPDGLLVVHAKLTTEPTITGGSTNHPAVFFIDIHYQSTSIGTLNKAPNFYA